MIGDPETEADNSLPRAPASKPVDPVDLPAEDQQDNSLPRAPAERKDPVQPVDPAQVEADIAAEDEDAT